MSCLSGYGESYICVALGHEERNRMMILWYWYREPTQTVHDTWLLPTGSLATDDSPLHKEHYYIDIFVFYGKHAARWWWILQPSWVNKSAQAFREIEIHRQCLFPNSQVVILLNEALCSDKWNNLLQLEGGQVYINKLRNRFTSTPFCDCTWIPQIGK